ncbi:MAG: hypothetical protein F6K25_09540 [Okeania sp. SIO2G4]|nr:MULTISPECIES: hypothetical protein [unclassified Okeania]NEP40122.1 hypothetical protein [Okeania sp. SIO2H7]NEP71843.1 hypothetical protein [Okeania sp. SIO2G5]NEP92863.1 hypothetical protein [Okeania sp. SIO2F5]NEQ90940.1 hypothetical protein [Okeania sp. SIO2G4]
MNRDQTKNKHTIQIELSGLVVVHSNGKGSTGSLGGMGGWGDGECGR